MKRVVAILLAVLGAVLFLALFWVRSDKQPAFEGKPISHYLALMRIPDDGSNNEHRYRAFQKATNAFHQMGTNGVNWLAKRLETKPGLYHSFWLKTPWALRALLPQPRSSSSSTLLDGRIFDALVHSGRLAVPVFTNYLDGRHPEIHQDIFRALSYPPLRDCAAEAIPVLEVQARGNHDPDRVLASYALSRIDPQRAPAAVLVMISILENTNSISRLSAADCLGILGELAKPAIPALEAAWRNPDPRHPRVQNEARSALQHITGKRYPLTPPGISPK